MSKAKEFLDLVDESFSGAVKVFLDTFDRVGDGNKAMKAALNAANSDGQDVDDVFTELASMTKLVKKSKDSPWDEKEIKNFIDKKFG